MKTSGKNIIAGQQFKHEPKTAYIKSPTGHVDPVAVVGKLRLCASLQSLFPTLSFTGPRTMFMLSK